MYKIDFPYKICIPYQDHPRGGMYTFLNYFKNYLKNHGILYTEDIVSFYDFLFINSFMTPYYKIRIAKLLNPKLKIVQRVDGAAQDYGRGIEWDFIQKKINKISDLTIFQSEYGRYATREKFQVIVNDGPVIYNPIDIDLFKPSQENVSTSSKPKIAFVTFSTNPQKGASQIFEIAKSNQDIDFYLIGRFEVNQKLISNNIYYTGLLNRNEIAKTIGSCHIFLFFSQNEACPNVVLEALASGLPVLYLDSGATSELVGDAGLPVIVENFKAKFEEIWQNWIDWSMRARQRAENKFSIQKIIPEYLDTMLNLKG